MNCNDARKWISPYLDSELGKTKTFEVTEHLRNCSACAERFAQEQQVDETVRSRLSSPVMPEDQWADFRRALTMPSWFRRLRSPQGLALAACLAIAVVSTAVGLRTEKAALPAIANRFLVESPDNHPFPPSSPGRVSIADTLRTEFGLRFASLADMAAKGHHDFELISASRKTDDEGHAYLEVRLNCCGRPVLLALARPVGGELPDVFPGVETTFGEKSNDHGSGIKLAHATMGGVHVVVVSRHAVQHIIDSLGVA